MWFSIVFCMFTRPGNRDDGTSHAEIWPDGDDGTPMELGMDAFSDALSESWRWIQQMFFSCLMTPGISLPPGKHTKSYWKWPFMVDLPIEMVIFHSYVSLPEGMLTTSKEMCVALSHAFQTNHRPHHRQHLLQVTIEILLIYGIYGSSWHLYDILWLP